VFAGSRSSSKDLLHTAAAAAAAGIKAGAVEESSIIRAASCKQFRSAQHISTNLPKQKIQEKSVLDCNVKVLKILSSH